MCGIVGIVLKRGQIESDSLRRAASLLTHRGPDDLGLFIDGRFGLAHTRLSIIDLAGGHQPLRSADGRLISAVNGEIYNYPELGAALREDGIAFTSASDSEMVPGLYQLALRDASTTHTPSVAAAINPDWSRLHGMFAAALIDRDEESLWLLRDRLGIKPLYYAQLPDRLLFASEIKALLALMPAQPEIEPLALLQFLETQFSSGNETIFRSIRRVPPGEALYFNKDLTLQRNEYWSATEIETVQMSQEEAEEHFQPLFTQVVEEHLRADVPYGLFLSGGVDSGLLGAAMMASKGGAERVKSFSIGFRSDSMADELDDAAATARVIGSDHQALRVTPEQLFAIIPYTTWLMDDLMRDYAVLPTALLAQEVSKSLKVVLTGEGGDEVFAGYRRYRKHPLQRLVGRALRPGSGGFRVTGQWRGSRSYQLFGSRLRPQRARFREPTVAAWRNAPSSWSDVQRSQFVDLTTALPDNLLLKVDRSLMGFALEGRVPLLDHRIVEFGLALPDQIKVGSGIGKRFLRRWGERSLPREMLWRSKRGFHVPIGDLFREPFLGQLQARLQHHRAIGEWFEPNRIDLLFREHRGGRSASREIWCLMQFAIWHRLFVDHPDERPSPTERLLDWID